MIGDTDKKSKSAYAPSKEVANFISVVKKDYEIGEEILSKGWTELNGRSVIEDLNRGQRMANAFVDEEVENPAEAWKWRGTRSMARNKGVAMHAQLTAAYLIPGFSAQNDDDEIDREFSDVMHDIVEWMTLPTNSDYQSSFLSLVFGMIESPATYLGAEWYEVYQTIKEKIKGGYSKKEILDEVLSGFKAPVYTVDQVLITNAYERNIQKQRRIFKRRWIDYSEAEAIYGEHENWDFVAPGVNTVFNEADGLFYDTYDPDHPTMVQEIVVQCRRDDSEVPFIGGIYMGDKDVENNPIKHRDNRNAPKYNIIPFGYNRIGSHFFYYKSMMNVVGWDNQLYDAMSEVIMNNAILEQDPPSAVMGSDKIDSDMNFPGSVTAFKDKDVKVQALFPAKNFSAGFQALMATKDSIDDASLSDTQMGQLPQASQKAYSVAQAQANAKKILGGIAKSLAESIVQYGPLMADITLNHLTTAQVDEIVGENSKLKYRKFTLEKQMVDGKQVDKEILFDEWMTGKEMSKSEKDDEEMKMFMKNGGFDSKKETRRINPYLFSKFRYLCRIDPEEIFPRNAETMQPLLSNLYTMLINDPFVNRETLLRELMYSFFRGRADKFIAEQPVGVPQGGQASNPLGGQASNPLGEMVKSTQLQKVAQGVTQ